MLRRPDVISTVNWQRSVVWEGSKVVYCETLRRRNFYYYGLPKCSCGNATYGCLKRNEMSVRICSRFWLII